jgi:phosphoribosylformylglycinamidine synthase
VAEAALNLACAGARPLAVVNCLNFGNPEHPEVMWQLSEAIDGMADACTALSVPVVGGNVSLYNESDGRDIDPTPVVGMVGVVDRLDRRPPGARLAEGGRLLLLGDPGRPTLAGSRWAETAHGHRGRTLPELDLAAHASLCRLAAELVAAALVEGVHDVSDGGLGVALAEMAVRAGIGFAVAGVDGHAGLFGEMPSRVVACVRPGDVAAVTSRARATGVAVTDLGDAGGDRLVVAGLVDLALDEAVRAWRDHIPDRLLVAPA